jgi:predicted transcriptional regulator
MDVYDVSETTIQNWLRSLKNEGMIEVVIEKKGMVSHRKIYVENFPSKEEIKIISPTLRNLSPRHSENDTLDTQKSESVIDNITQSSITEQIKQVVVVVSREGSQDKKKLELGDVYGYAIKFKKDWLSSEIEEAWKRLCSSKHLIEDELKYIEGIINKIRINELHKTKKEKTSCQPKKASQKSSERSSDYYAANATSEAPLAKFARQNGLS